VNDFWLNNTNTADIAGDAYFICTSGMEMSYFQWVSQWQVQVNTTWGQYQLCNFGIVSHIMLTVWIDLDRFFLTASHILGVCLGGDSDLVGREMSDGLGLPSKF